MNDLEFWKSLATDPDVSNDALWEALNYLYNKQEVGRIWLAIFAETDAPET